MWMTAAEVNAALADLGEPPNHRPGCVLDDTHHAGSCQESEKNDILRDLECAKRLAEIDRKFAEREALHAAKMARQSLDYARLLGCFILQRKDKVK